MGGPFYANPHDHRSPTYPRMPLDEEMILTSLERRLQLRKAWVWLAAGIATFALCLAWAVFVDGPWWLWCITAASAISNALLGYQIDRGYRLVRDLERLVG